MYIAESNIGDQGAGNDDIPITFKTLIFPTLLVSVIAITARVVRFSDWSGVGVPFHHQSGPVA